MKLFFKSVLIFLFSLSLFGCEQTISKSKLKNDLVFENRYKNLGFALIYDENHEKITKTCIYNSICCYCINPYSPIYKDQKTWDE